MKKGKVTLVGAGPGAPELITLKALKAIQSADIIVYDRLINKQLLKDASEKCKVIYAGKKAGKHTIPQDKISELLIEDAKKGKNVVRLKGGDPFVFGRGGEEVLALAKAGVKFEIIPGITSAIAVPELAGIPITHRKYASSVAIVTGHKDPTKKRPLVKWEMLAKAVDTIIILMGVKQLKNIVERILSGGRKPSTPVAIIEKGTMAKQRTIIGNLSNVVKKAKANKIGPPAIIVIGDVVKLRKELK